MISFRQADFNQALQEADKETYINVDVPFQFHRNQETLLIGIDDIRYFGGPNDISLLDRNAYTFRDELREIFASETDWANTDRVHYRYKVRTMHSAENLVKDIANKIQSLPSVISGVEREMWNADKMTLKFTYKVREDV